MFYFLVCFPRGDLTAITLCGQAVECFDMWGLACPCANSSVCATFTRARCDRSTMSGRFDLLVRDFESCQTQDTCAAQLTHARLQQQGSRSVSSCCVSVTLLTHASNFLANLFPLRSRCQIPFVWGCCLLVLLVSGTLQRKCHFKCRRSVAKSDHHGR